MLGIGRPLRANGAEQMSLGREITHGDKLTRAAEMASFFAKALELTWLARCPLRSL